MYHSLISLTTQKLGLNILLNYCAIFSLHNISFFQFIVSILNTSFKEQLIIETVVPNEDYYTGTSARKKNFDTDINTNSY